MLSLSNVEWGTARGRCRLNAAVQSCTGKPEDVTLRLSLIKPDGDQELAQAQVNAPSGISTLVSLDYDIPPGLSQGELRLTAALNGKVVLSRMNRFDLGEPIQLRMRREILSTASEGMDAILWLRYGAASLSNAKLVGDVNNEDRSEHFRGEVPKIGGPLACLSLSTKIIGKGCGRVTVSLVDANGTAVASASVPYEIIQDPFEQ